MRYFAYRSVLLLTAALSPVAALAVFGNPSYVDTTRYRSVGEFGNLTGSGSFNSYASAVAIDPFWVLTARHVDGDAIRINGEVYNAVQNIADTDSDLRLIRVDRAISDYARIGTFDAVGSQVTLVGYGGTGTGVSDGAYNVGPADGQRHTAVNVIDGIGSMAFNEDQTPWTAYFYDLDDPDDAEGGYVAGEGGLWGGDSGGGWFVDTIDGPQLIALSTAVYNPARPDGGNANEFGSYGIGTRLSDRMEFIDRHVNAVPEPATCAFLGLGAAALMRRRKRA